MSRPRVYPRGKISKKKIPAYFSYYLKYCHYLLKLVVWKCKHSSRRKKRIALTFGISILLIAIIAPLYKKWASIPRAPKLKMAAQNSLYLYTAKSKKFQVQLGDKNSNLPIVEFSTSENNKIAFVPAGVNKKLQVPIKEDKKLLFKNVYPNIDFEYQTIPLGVKEEIIINQPSQIVRFPFGLKTEGAIPQYITENISGTAFFDKDGNYLFHFEKPFAYDAKTSQTDNVQILIKRDLETKNYSAIITIDPNWLNSPERVFPVLIDPTVVHDESSEFANGQFNRVKDTGSGASPSLETYYQELPADGHTVGLWHMNNSWNDSSKNGHNGTAQGTPTFSTPAKLGSHSGSFDADTDYVSISDSDQFTLSGDYTVEVWINPDNIADDSKGIVGTYTGGSNGFIFALRNNSTNELSFWGGGTWAYSGHEIKEDGEWKHVAYTRSGTTGIFYVDGKSVKTVTATAGTNGGALHLGAGGTSWASYRFDGLIDEVRISNIARTPEEIKLAAQRRPYAVYTSDSIDLGTLVASLDSLEWTESGVQTGDGETPYSSSNLAGFWKFNETSDTSAADSSGQGNTGTLNSFSNTSGQDVVAGSGWTTNNGRWPQNNPAALMFDGSNDYVSLSNNPLSGTTYTVEAWFRTSDPSTTKSIFAQRSTTDSDSILGQLYTPSSNIAFITRNDTGGNSALAQGTTTLQNGTWYHAVGVRDGANVYVYLNGVLEGSDNDAGGTITTNTRDIGRWNSGGSPGGYFNGIIDSFRIYSRALGADEILSNYQSGQIEFQTRTSADNSSWEAWKPTANETQIDSMDNPLNWATPSASIWEGVPIATSSSSLAIEGNGSLKTILGAPQVDSHTVALWHLDETNGDLEGDDVFDETANNNDGELYGTAPGPEPVESIFGKARDFNGTDDYVDCGDDNIWDFGSGNYAIEAWVKRNSFNTNDMIIGKDDDGSGNRQFFMLIHSDDDIRFSYTDTGDNQIYLDSSSTITDNEWHYLAGQRNGDSFEIYIDGVLDNSGTTSGTHGTMDSTVTNLLIGKRHYSGYTDEFDGIIDEVRISNVARSAEEISEAYRAGRDHRLGRTISSTDLSSKGKLPFYIAADRPGTYLETTIGESAYTNNQPDGNTKGLWHLEENQPIFYDYFLTDTTGRYSWETVDTNAPTNSHAWDSSNHWLHVLTGDNDAENATAYADIPTSGYAKIVFIKRLDYPTDNVQSLYLFQDANNYYQFNWQGSGYSTQGVYKVVGSSTVDSSAERGTVDTNGNEYTIEMWWTPSSMKLAIDGTVRKDITTTNTTAINPSYFKFYSSQINFDWESIEIHSLDEIKDSSGNGNHGYPSGTTFLQGKIGKARDLNGSSNYINVNDSASLDMTDSYTTEAWVRFDTTSSNQVIYAKGKSGDVYNGGLDWTTTDNFRFYGSPTGGAAVTYTLTPNTGEWYYIVGVFDNSGNTSKLYINGAEVASATDNGTPTANNYPLWIGARKSSTGGVENPFDGTIDEVRISDTARTAAQIRQAYEIGQRTHPITIDFAAKLDANDIKGTSEANAKTDTSITIDATHFGLTDKGSNLYEDDKIIVRENYGGTEYIAQGTVSSITTSTGAVTVDSWTGTVPNPDTGVCGGSDTHCFTSNASVFKWQREYWDISDPPDNQLDTCTQLTLRVTNADEGRTVWLDDFESASDYMATPGGSSISSTAQRYFQYRAIISNHSPSPSLTSVTLNYTENNPPGATTLSDAYLHDNLKTNDTTPEIRFAATDPESDNLTYQIQWDTDTSFPSPSSAVSDTNPGFTNVDDGGDDDPFNSGDTISYTFQAALTNNTTYFYKVHAKDPGGSNTYGNWSSVRSFTIDTSLTNDAWFQTHADQFSTDTLANGATVDDSSNYVYTLSSFQIDNADTASNWVSSDTGDLLVEQETSLKQEGTGSVKLSNNFTGDGADGAITVSSNKNLNTDPIASGRSVADAEAFQVSSIGTNIITVTGTGTDGTAASSLSNSISSDDEIILINLRDSSSTYTNVGNYEFCQVSSISSATITCNINIQKTYGESSNSDLTGQNVVVQRVPNYTNVTINNGITLTVNSWNGTYGGLIAFRANGTVTVTGTIDTYEKGYRGGSGSSGDNYGYQGESTSGTGSKSMSYKQQGGGGGGDKHVPAAHNASGGGGGGYGTNGSNGKPCTQGGGVGAGGHTYGSSSLDKLYLGSGGGEGGSKDPRSGGNGGNAGGIVFIGTDTISVSGYIKANGRNGWPGQPSEPYTAGGGGGSGGSILLQANTATLGSSLVKAGGGSGGSGYVWGGAGGSGGSGRIRVEADSITGTTSPAASTTGSPSGDALNETATLTKSATDLSITSFITFWARSDRTGQFMRFQFGESASDEQTYDITINSADTWEKKTWDISGISAADRDAVTKFAYKVTNADSAFAFYFDDIQATYSSGTIMSTSITVVNIYSSASHWKQLLFTDDEANGDIKYKIYYDDSGTPTIVPDGDLTDNSSGFDTSPVDLTSLDTTSYPILYVQGTLTYSGGSPQLQDWQLSLNTKPNTPSLDLPSDTASNQILYTVLKTTTTDADSDYLHYKIELDTVNTFDSANLQTFDQTESQTGWSGQDAQSETAYASGTQATYTIQTALDNNTTYYWRSYAIDPAGTNLWSSTQETPYSFTTAAKPNAPSHCLIEEAVDDSYLNLKWQDNSGDETGFDIQRNESAAGFTSLTTKPADSTSHQDSTISQTNTYAYRVRAYKTVGGETLYSGWCTTATVSLESATFEFQGVNIQGVDLQ